MLYAHDIWVSWHRNCLNRLDVPRFDEWRDTEDVFELIDQIPLLYVTADLYEAIVDEEKELPKSLLSAIQDRTKVKVDYVQQSIKFAAVVTDGEEVMTFRAIDGYMAPIEKSRLIIRQERMVLEMIEPFEPEDYGYKKVVESYDWLVDGIRLEKEHFVGLTRTERNMKKLGVSVLEDLYLNERMDELIYWFVEWNPKVYESLLEWSFDEAWQAMLEGYRAGWSDHHVEFTNRLCSGTEYHAKKLEECKIPKGVYKTE